MFFLHRVKEPYENELQIKLSPITYTFVCVTLAIVLATMLKYSSISTMDTLCGRCPNVFSYESPKMAFLIMWKSYTAIAPFLLIQVRKHIIFPEIFF